MVSITYIFIVSITLYMVVLYHVGYKFMCQVMVYIVILNPIIGLKQWRV